MRRKLFWLAACTVTFLLFQNFRPQFPSRNVDTVVLKKEGSTYKPTNHHIPFLEMSRDGRLALARKSRDGGQPLHILRPEKVQGHLRDERNPIIGSGLGGINYDALLKPLELYGAFAADVRRTDHPGVELDFSPSQSLICEKTEVKKSPYVCDSNRDCYSLTLVTRFGVGGADADAAEGSSPVPMRWGSIDLEIAIENPKTPSARVARVTPVPGSVRIGPIHQYILMAEPVIVGDGRLLVTRLGFDNATMPDRVTVVPKTNIVYSVYPATDPQCDVTRWTHFHPIWGAPHDTVNNMAARYKFARYPFRDSLGRSLVRFLSDGRVDPRSLGNGASYPWMDRHAANLFFQSFGEEDFYHLDPSSGQVRTPYPESRRSGYSFLEGLFFDAKQDFARARAPFESSGTRTVGTAMAGFWSHGKMVLFDGLINNADYGFTVMDRIVETSTDVERLRPTREVRLYTHTPNGASFEKVGAVREIGLVRGAAKEYSPVMSGNTSFIGSIENRLNLVEALKPVTPRDVVWSFGTTRHTDELVFDDYMSPYFLVNAEMTAAIAPGRNSMRLQHFTGIQSAVHVKSSFVDFPENPPLASLLLQNASTAPDSFMRVPRYGKLIGEGRVEPIAKGGIYGKGLWILPQSSVEFQIPAQTGAGFDLAAQRRWYASVFLDPRERLALGESRALFSLGEVQILLERRASDGRAYDSILLKNQGIPVARKALPAGLTGSQDYWRNIGVLFGQKQSPQVFINGYLAGSFEPLPGVDNTRSLGRGLRLEAGQKIVLGRSAGSSELGVTGWYDEFKVRAGLPTREEICNYARGTLIEVSSLATEKIRQTADRYPAAAHQEIRRLVRESDSSKKYLCFTRYNEGKEVGSPLQSELHAHLKNLPKGTRSVREEALQMRSQLVFGSPRPSMMKNRFCLSCHVSPSLNPFVELNEAALGRRSLAMEKDSRRQPLQPDARLRGIIPANYFGPGMPSSLIKSGASGEAVDRWLHPRIPSVRVSWNSLGSGVQYRLDRMDRQSGRARYVRSCVGRAQMSKMASLTLAGACPSRADAPKLVLNSEVSVRICYWRVGETTDVVCTPFTPLSHQRGGTLSFKLELERLHPIDDSDPDGMPDAATEF